MTPAPKVIEVEGVAYVAISQRPLTEEAKDLLNEVYCRLWTEAYYDPYNDAVKELALELAPKMQRLNEILGFKR